MAWRIRLLTVWLPVQPGRVHFNELALVDQPHVLVYDPCSDSNDVVPLPVLDQVEGLQRCHNVICSDGGDVTDIFDADVGAMYVKRLQNLARPVAAVAHLIPATQLPLNRPYSSACTDHEAL